MVLNGNLYIFFQLWFFVVEDEGMAQTFLVENIFKTFL